jgi:hypothetical protein
LDDDVENETTQEKGKFEAMLTLGLVASWATNWRWLRYYSRR